MKIILSRKGFDSASGGVASPIFDHGDGQLGLYSMPIPLQQSTCGYEDIQWRRSNLHELISSLRSKKRKPLPNTPHLDPDLVREALDRAPGWYSGCSTHGQQTSIRELSCHSHYSESAQSVSN